MSLRDSRTLPALPESHVFVTFTRGRAMRTFALRPVALYSLVGLVPAACLGALAAAGWFVLRDDVLARLMARQAEMQYAYEDRLAAMRAQIDRVTSRQLLDQDSFEGKVHDLLSRQAQLESRGAVVAALAEQVEGVSEAKKTKRPPARPAASAPAQNPLAGPAPSLPAGASAFAPLESPSSQAPAPAAGGAKPALRSSALEDEPIPVRIERIAASLDRIEAQQVIALGRLEDRASREAKQARLALSEAGLSPDRLTPPATKSGAVGGPFIPLKVDANGSPFEREVARLQSVLLQADRFRRVLPHVPLRLPVNGDAEQTSGFGTRIDPFLGRPALHAGVDFRDDYGAPIRATAHGKIVTAGYQGGYGKMVEIDHGNGLTTRYAHLSAIAVDEGDDVAAGAMIGRLGSTGRSTGPHLHYEVRIDGDAVDPTRFIRAGRRIAADAN